MSAPLSRQYVSIAGLLREVRRVAAKIPDVGDNGIPLSDHLMSGLALFGLKYPSLLQFDHDRQEATVRANLRALYGVERAPCDTRLRERLDLERRVSARDTCRGHPAADRTRAMATTFFQPRPSCHPSASPPCGEASGCQ